MLNDGPAVKNLIFDLGGVILNISPQRTIDAFARLAALEPDFVSETYHQRPEFKVYEKGELSDAEFRSALRELFSTSAADAELDACWNAMLLDIPIERIRLLEALRTRYRLFLLSNTNNIHAQHFNQLVNRSTRHENLESLFDKAYYSHVIGMRKPDREIYEFVLQQNGNMTARETLFLDDSPMNLEAAQQLGIQTYHVYHSDLILSLFGSY